MLGTLFTIYYLLLETTSTRLFLIILRIRWEITRIWSGGNSYKNHRTSLSRKATSIRPRSKSPMFGAHV